LQLSNDRAREAAEKEGYIFFYSYKPEPIAIAASTTVNGKKRSSKH